MAMKGILNKTLALTGTVFLWFPILGPIVLSVLVLASTGAFHFDYLMPAELFPAVVIGGILLMGAALRTRSYRKLIGWSLGAAVLLLVGGQALAVVTGLASGETDATGWQFAVVMVAIAAYTAAVVLSGLGGIFLLRDLFKTQKTLAEPG